MDDDTIIQILKEVKDDAAELALATIDLQFPDLSKGDRDAMRSALEVAAVPHWFNEEILANLLDCTSVESAPLIVRLRQLSVVETFTARGPGAVNLHETTRLALRARLKRMPFGSIGDSVQTKTSNRLAAISSRA